MEAFSSRTAMLIGEKGVEILKNAHVAVFGIGGVGGSACEALARAGVGSLSIFDDDTVNESNLNRQAAAYISKLGMAKVQAMAQIIADINPACDVIQHRVFYLPENAGGFNLSQYDYIIDAVDTVSAKLEIICRANAAGIPVISAMGAGNKLHPELFKVGDIKNTSVCPLARVLRRECKKRGISKLKVVYSTEQPIIPPAQPKEKEGPDATERPGREKSICPGSISFVPAAAGLILAGEAVRDLLKSGGLDIQ